MKNFIIDQLKKYTTLAMVLVSFVSLILGPLSAVNGYAEASTQVIAGFSDCTFTSATNKNASTNGGQILIKCLQQILTFFFVLGLFLMAFRITFVALGNLNPMADSKALGQSVTLVREIIIGLILIGAPALILSVLNPGALQLDFLDLSGLRRSSSLTPISTPQNPTQARATGNQSSDEATNTLLRSVDKSSILDAATRLLQDCLDSSQTPLCTTNLTTIQKVFREAVNCSVFDFQTSISRCDVLNDKEVISSLYSILENYKQAGIEYTAPVQEESNLLSNEVFVNNNITITSGSVINESSAIVCFDYSFSETNPGNKFCIQYLNPTCLTNIHVFVRNKNTYSVNTDTSLNSSQPIVIQGCTAQYIL